MFLRHPVQYGDWHGTAAADDTHLNSLDNYLKRKNLIEPGEFLIAAEVFVGETDDSGKLGSVSARAFLFRGHSTKEGVQAALAKIEGPIPVREVDIPLTLGKFVALFKRFDVMLTWRDLSLEDRQYRTLE